MNTDYSIKIIIEHEIPLNSENCAVATIEFGVVLMAANAHQALNMAVTLVCETYSISDNNFRKVTHIDIIPGDER